MGNAGFISSAVVQVWDSGFRFLGPLGGFGFGEAVRGYGLRAWGFGLGGWAGGSGFGGRFIGFGLLGFGD